MMKVFIGSEVTKIERKILGSKCVTCHAQIFGMEEQDYIFALIWNI